MQTNFFQALAGLQIEGDWNITIKTGTHNRMIVTVLLQNKSLSDTASRHIPPMIFKGTTEQLDAGFFQALHTPAKKTAELFANMEEYAKGQELALSHSKMEQAKQQQQKKEKTSDNNKFDVLMKKVTELQEAGKFREAYGQVPKVADFPEQEESIQQKKQELLKKFEPSLF